LNRAASNSACRVAGEALAPLAIGRGSTGFNGDMCLNPGIPPSATFSTDRLTVSGAGAEAVAIGSATTAVGVGGAAGISAGFAFSSLLCLARRRYSAIGTLCLGGGGGGGVGSLAGSGVGSLIGSGEDSLGTSGSGVDILTASGSDSGFRFSIVSISTLEADLTGDLDLDPDSLTTLRPLAVLAGLLSFLFFANLGLPLGAGVTLTRRGGESAAGASATISVSSCSVETEGAGEIDLRVLSVSFSNKS